MHKSRVHPKSWKDPVVGLVGFIVSTQSPVSVTETAQWDSRGIIRLHVDAAHRASCICIFFFYEIVVFTYQALAVHGCFLKSFLVELLYRY